MQELDVQANLRNAILCEDVQSTRSALQEGADVNAFDDLGWTPLMLAVLRNSPEICQLLLLNGANPTTSASDGLDALTMAVSKNNSVLVELFLNHEKKQILSQVSPSETNINSRCSVDLVQDLLQRALEVYEEILLGLTPKEAAILRLRFPRRGEQMTLEKIGQQYQLTRQRISQIVAKAIRKIRHPARHNRLEVLFTDIWNYANQHSINVNTLKSRAICMDQGLGLLFCIYIARYDQ